MAEVTGTLKIELLVPQPFCAFYKNNTTQIRTRLTELGLWPANTLYARWRLDPTSGGYLASLAVTITTES